MVCAPFQSSSTATIVLALCNFCIIHKIFIRTFFHNFGFFCYSVSFTALTFCSLHIVLYFFSLFRYNISWTVESHTPVEEFKLYFRRLPQGHDIENSIEHSQQPLQHHGSSAIGSNGQPHRYGNVIMHWSRNDWRDVVLPAVPLSHHYSQAMSYMIRGLDPENHYEARVQAR